MIWIHTHTHAHTRVHTLRKITENWLMCWANRKWQIPKFFLKQAGWQKSWCGKVPGRSNVSVLSPKVWKRNQCTKLKIGREGSFNFTYESQTSNFLQALNELDKGTLDTAIFFILPINLIFKPHPKTCSWKHVSKMYTCIPGSPVAQKAET